MPGSQCATKTPRRAWHLPWSGPAGRSPVRRAKGHTPNNFPLRLTNVELALREADGFLHSFLPRIEWDAFIQASRKVTRLVIFRSDRSISKWQQTNSCRATFLNKIGGTSLPMGRSEMLDDDLSKSSCTMCFSKSVTSYFYSPSRRLS